MAGVKSYTRVRLAIIAATGLLLVLSLTAHALSLALTLKRKVMASKAVLRVSVTNAKETVKPYLGPAFGRGQNIVVCEANVVEVLKGSNGMKKIEFQFQSYSDFKPEELSSLAGKEFYVFLHRPYDASPKLREMEPDPKWWLFEGPSGMRPLATEYIEYKDPLTEKLDHETMSHSNWVAAIRRFVSEEKK